MWTTSSAATAISSDRVLGTMMTVLLEPTACEGPHRCRRAASQETPASKRVWIFIGITRTFQARLDLGASRCNSGPESGVP